jgi:hypothetical protein
VFGVAWFLFFRGRLMVMWQFSDTILLYLIQNAPFMQNRTVLAKARDYSLRNMLSELQELHKAEVCF